MTSQRGSVKQEHDASDVLNLNPKVEPNQGEILQNKCPVPVVNYILFTEEYECEEEEDD